MINYRIREPIDKEIINCINVLYSAFDRPLPPNIKKEERVWKALIESEIGNFLIAEEGGKFFGIGGVFLFEKVSSFGYMAVLPKYRGNGVGTEIFRNLMKIANERNCETRFLYASTLGKPIYEKFGFQDRFYGTMFQLPIKFINEETQYKQVKILRKVPEWAFNLDEKTMGFNRRRYLHLKIELGAKILAIENEGYGLLVDKRLGPLIANNLKTALQIIKKSIKLGADHLILACHKNFPNTLISSMNLTKKVDGANIKMVYGQELSENLEALYAIGTYAKG
ncbi:MAG: GNAT family N-acetyltransferase [Candidatus Hermodarchaeota archaeon]